MLLILSHCFLEFPVSTLLQKMFSGDSRKRKVSDNFCVFSSATELLGLGLCFLLFFFVFGASFLRLRLPSFWKLVAAVCFMLILPELFQFTRIQANRAVAQSDERRRLIKAYIRTYILSDPRRSRLSLRSGALSLTQTAPLLQSSVVDFCCRA